jgi:hypothetical protein
MAIVQISKLQVRAGAETDLPQLDIGELGFATDTQNVYIGNDPTIIPPVGPVPTVTQLVTKVQQPPSTSSSAGVAGQIYWDSSYIYVCTTSGIQGQAVWKRVSLSTF